VACVAGCRGLAASCVEAVPTYRNTLQAHFTSPEEGTWNLHRIFGTASTQDTPNPESLKLYMLFVVLLVVWMRVYLDAQYKM
jgi:hypothetical protein